MRSRIAWAMDLFSDGRYFRLRLFFEGIVAGLGTGLVISLFRFLLELTDGLRPRIYAFLQTAEPWYLLLFFVGLMLLGLLTAGIVEREPGCTGSGLPQLKGILLGQLHMHWASVLLYKLAGCVLALGAGMSLGRAAPSCAMGGCIGQGTARLFGASRAEERFLLAAGAAAGLGATFNAPLAGVLFCLEEMTKSFSPLLLLTAIAAAVSGTAVTELFFGGLPIFHIGGIPVLPIRLYAMLLLLGLFAGLLGAFFTRSLLYSLDAYDRWLPGRCWRMVLPFCLAGAAGFVLPEIQGGGNELVDLLAGAHYGLLFLLLLFAAKLLFTMVCFGSGVPGGIFLPMLALGALAGAFFSEAAGVLGLMDAQYAPTLVAFGMAAYFAAVVKAPVTGSVLVLEMTGSFAHMLPLICVSMAAYIVSDMLDGQPVYEALLNRSLLRAQRVRKAVRRRRVMLELRVGTGSALDGQAMQSLQLPGHGTLLNVTRSGLQLTPDAVQVLQPGDFLYVLADDTETGSLQQLAAERP